MVSSILFGVVFVFLFFFLRFCFVFCFFRRRNTHVHPVVPFTDGISAKEMKDNGVDATQFLLLAERCVVSLCPSGLVGWLGGCLVGRSVAWLNWLVGQLVGFVIHSRTQENLLDIHSLPFDRPGKQAGLFRVLLIGSQVKACRLLAQGNQRLKTKHCLAALCESEQCRAFVCVCVCVLSLQTTCHRTIAGHKNNMPYIADYAGHVFLKMVV